MALGNSEMSGFAVQALFKALGRNLNLLRLKTLASDASAEQNLDDLERLNDETCMGSSFVARFWNERADIDRGIMCLLSGIIEVGKPLGCKHNYLNAVSASSSPELLKRLLNVDAEVAADTPKEQEKPVLAAIQATIGMGGDVDSQMEESAVLSNNESKPRSMTV